MNTDTATSSSSQIVNGNSGKQRGGWLTSLRNWKVPTYCDVFLQNGAKIELKMPRRISTKQPIWDKKKLSIATLTEEFKPIALRSFEIANRQNNIFGVRILRRSEFHSKEQNQRLFKLGVIFKYKTVNSDLNWIEEFKAVVLEKNMSEYRDMSLLIALLPLLSYQDSNSNVENSFLDF